MQQVWCTSISCQFNLSNVLLDNPVHSCVQLRFTLPFPYMGRFEGGVIHCPSFVSITKEKRLGCYNPNRDISPNPTEPVLRWLHPGVTSTLRRARSGTASRLPLRVSWSTSQPPARSAQQLSYYPTCRLNRGFRSSLPPQNGSSSSYRGVEIPHGLGLAPSDENTSIPDQRAS